ncbi:MAG: hypothetical protein KF708_02190 [Pirellulales bacterium]|nr:hypothetical protein [Pirellulales bacterium]
MAISFRRHEEGSSLQWQTWWSLSDDDLAKRDIAETNLFLGFGLPPVWGYDIEPYLRKIDEWTELVETATRRAIRRRLKHGADADLSTNQYRILVLITVLQRDLRLRYYLPFSQGDYDGTDSQNLFIHGILDGHGGTCCTMPVLYAAISRRLGYPIKLATAKEHLFCRWDDPDGERFNIEATSLGFHADYDDEHYMTWPGELNPADVKRGWYLKSQSPREELAIFLSHRAHCLLDNFDFAAASTMFSYAHRLMPDFPGYHQSWGIALLLHDVVRHLRKQSAGGRIPERIKIPTPTEEWERQLYPIVQKELTRLLRNRLKQSDEPPYISLYPVYADGGRSSCSTPKSAAS